MMDMEHQTEEFQKIEMKINDLREEIALANASLQASVAKRKLLEESSEYRLGRAVTAPLRKVRKLMKAVKRHAS